MIKKAKQSYAAQYFGSALGATFGFVVAESLYAMIGSTTVVTGVFHDPKQIESVKNFINNYDMISSISKCVCVALGSMVGAAHGNELYNDIIDHFNEVNLIGIDQSDVHQI